MPNSSEKLDWAYYFAFKLNKLILLYLVLIPWILNMDKNDNFVTKCRRRFISSCLIFEAFSFQISSPLSHTKFSPKMQIGHWKCCIFGAMVLMFTKFVPVQFWEHSFLSWCQICTKYNATLSQKAPRFSALIYSTAENWCKWGTRYENNYRYWT